MTLFAPGSFAWLALHEIRLGWRSRSKKAMARWIGYGLAAVWVACGIMIAVALMHVTLRPTPGIFVGVLAASIVAFTFMVTQAILGSQRTLYETRDLDLLLTAPMPPRDVLLAKLLGIAGTIVLTYAALLLPIALPVAILGHPRLFGVVLLLASLALGAAAIGIAITLALARIAGPRAARTVGQIAAALFGGAIFLTTQLMNDPGHGHRRSSFERVFDELQRDGFGTQGIGSWPGRAAFAEPLPLLGCIAIGIALFVLAGVVLQRLFLSGYQDAGVRLSRARPTGRATARLFRSGLFATIFAKEWRLLARDPALAFQIVLRLVYMAPLVLIAFRSGDGPPIAPTMAFASVLIASQLAGSFAWLAISAEDAPDLLTVAPIPKPLINQAKLMAALAMTAPLAIILPIAIAAETLPGALVTLALTAAGGALAGIVELKLGKPGQRSAFAKRRGSGFVSGILSLLIAVVFGGAAAVAVFYVSGARWPSAQELQNGSGYTQSSVTQFRRD